MIEIETAICLNNKKICKRNSLSHLKTLLVHRSIRKLLKKVTLKIIHPVNVLFSPTSYIHRSNVLTSSFFKFHLNYFKAICKQVVTFKHFDLIYIAFVVKPERDGEMWSKDNGKEFRDLVLQKKIVFLKKINRVRKKVTHDCV